MVNKELKDINSELLIIAEYLTVYLCKRRLLSENRVQQD